MHFDQSFMLVFYKSAAGRGSSRVATTDRGRGPRSLVTGATGTSWSETKYRLNVPDLGTINRACHRRL